MKKKQGFDSALDVLHRIDPDSRKNIMRYITEKDKELAEALSKALFTFKDLVHVTQNGIQLLMKTIEREKWLLALRNAEEALINHILSSMSERAATLLKEDIDALGPQPLKKVNDAQSYIADTARTLKENGQIVIVRPGEQDPYI